MSPLLLLEDFGLTSGVSWDLGGTLDIFGRARVSCPYVDDDLFGAPWHGCHQICAETRRANDENICLFKFHLESSHLEDVTKYPHDWIVPS
jgi:hypothetical protein